MTGGVENYRMERATPDETALVAALAEAGDAFVSGNDLARQLGVSRPAIKAKLDKLRTKGYALEAVRNRGYRLQGEPEVIEPALLAYQLKRLDCPVPALYFPVIDSTNSEAERQQSRNRAAPFAVLSSCQTRGRGRLGRNWHSASPDNLYLSVCFTPDIPPQQLQHFTLWAGIRVCRCLQPFVPKARLQVKWPNDLHCEGRKFAGMLTEARMDADRIRSIIFGIGLNVNGNPLQFPPELRPSATSLHAVHGQTLSLNEVAARVIHAVQKAYEGCIGGSPTESLAEAWPPLDALAGKTVQAQTGGREISGLACGIDEGGALLLRDATGATTALRAGDVSLKKEG